MSTILPAFDAIRIVSLADRHDRREQVLREFARFGVRVGEGSVQLFDAIRPLDEGEFPTTGARGCFLSHLAILREARQNGFQRTLILEDDALFTPAFSHADSLVDFARSDAWEFLYPGHIIRSEPGPLRWIPTNGGVQCTHAYAVQASVLDPLITFLEAILGETRPRGPHGPMHVDAAYSVFMADNPQVRVYRASRSLVIQRSSRSDVTTGRGVDRLIPASMLGIVRSIKSWIRVRAH